VSAYIVDKSTIDALITISIALDRAADGSNEPPSCMEGFAKYDRLGMLLVNANHRSVNYRYGEHTRAPAYRFEAVPISRPFTIAVLKRAHGALRSYTYQSCEFPRWEMSKARAWCDALEARLSAATGSVRGEGWDISDSERATALVDGDPPLPYSYQAVQTEHTCPHGRRCANALASGVRPCRKCYRATMAEGAAEAEAS
jgi:hypothetical protein